MHILVVDDSAHRSAFFQNGLKGHKVTVCHHARAAIKALRSSSFDAIFLDYDLTDEPEGDNNGGTVAYYIADHGIACPCIILHSENRDGREAMEAILVGQACQSIPYSKLRKIGLRAALKAGRAES
jgi:CheY-like chemotaxis protein